MFCLENPGKFFGSGVLAIGRSGYWKRWIFFFPPKDPMHAWTAIYHSWYANISAGALLKVATSWVKRGRTLHGWCNKISTFMDGLYRSGGAIRERAQDWIGPGEALHFLWFRVKLPICSKSNKGLLAYFSPLFWRIWGIGPMDRIDKSRGKFTDFLGP